MARQVSETNVVTTRDELSRLLGNVRPSTEVATRGSNMSMDQLSKKALDALLQLGNAQALLGRFNGEQPPVGSVLRWIDREDALTGEVMVDVDGRGKMQMQRSKEVVYVAHRIAERKGNSKRDWLVSPPLRGEYQVDYDSILDALGPENEAWLASKWNEVPAAPVLSASDVDPTEFAQRMFGDKAAASSDEATETKSD